MITPESNRQTRLIMVLIVFAGFLSGYIYYTQVAEVVDEGLPPLNDNPSDSLRKFGSITFDFQLFSSDSIKSFKTFGEAPVKFDQTGKTNPFSSF